MIGVLLATFNGEKYLDAQLSSLFSQTVNDFVLYIRDDCSTDNTLQIINAWKNRYPTHINVDISEKNSGSAKHNFLAMMTRIREDYIFLCDQDDVWLPNKIEKTLAKMRQAEAEFGKTTPICVHTDLTVVDSELNIISPSFRTAMHGGWERRYGLNHALIMNVVTGCTACYNRTLANLITTAPRYCVEHDWWLYLIAAAFGKVTHIDDCTILYRQHRNNEIGAKDVRTMKFLIESVFDVAAVKKAVRETYIQAEAFAEMFENTAVAARYAAIAGKNKFERIAENFRLNTWKHGAFRKVAQLIYL